MVCSGWLGPWYSYRVPRNTRAVSSRVYHHDLKYDLLQVLSCGVRMPSRARETFSMTSRRALEPTQSLIQLVPGCISGDKAAEVWRCPFTCNWPLDTWLGRPGAGMESVGEKVSCQYGESNPIVRPMACSLYNVMLPHILKENKRKIFFPRANQI